MKRRFRIAMAVLMGAAPVAAAPPVYVSIVSHNEEGTPYVENQTFYLQNREFVRRLALAVKQHGAMWDFQSDWKFLRAVDLYDRGTVVTNTNGKNIVRWLVEDMGFAADPHAHETQYNYADVAYLHTVLGVQPKKVVGGFLFSPPDNAQGWEQHATGISGWQYPAYFFKGDTLWGAGTQNHQGNDDRSYGVWRPQDRYHFYVHDPGQTVLNVGGGCQSSAGAASSCTAGVLKILDAIADGSVPADGFYTASIFVAQGGLNDTVIQQVVGCLDALAPYADLGLLVWSDLSSTAQRWTTDYGEQPFRVACSTLSTLAATKSVASGTVSLSWAEGAPPYALRRAEDPRFLVNPTLLLQESNATAFEDPALGDGRSYFYRVE